MSQLNFKLGCGVLTKTFGKPNWRCQTSFDSPPPQKQKEGREGLDEDKGGNMRTTTREEDKQIK